MTTSAPRTDTILDKPFHINNIKGYTLENYIITFGKPCNARWLWTSTFLLLYVWPTDNAIGLKSCACVHVEVVYKGVGTALADPVLAGPLCHGSIVEASSRHCEITVL